MEFLRKGGDVAGRLGTIRSDKRGGALVEFALTLPVFLMLITAIFSFSMAIYEKLELAEAVAAGGRYLASDRGDSDPCKDTAAVIAAAAPTLASGGLTYAFSINGGTATGATCTGSSGANNMVSGGTALVSAGYTCSIKVYRFTFTGCTLASTITEEVQ
ncbi:MAG: TadE/TadG family type IV pilus assembly protein [Acidobacteriaceae bacterium]